MVHLVTGGSYIQATATATATTTATTPSAFGSYADPRVSFAFGLDLTYRIDLPRAGAHFLSGRTDFTVAATTAVGGDGLFADQWAADTLSSLWAEDDPASYKRKFVVVHLPTEAPLSVTCSVAAPYHWVGSVTDVVAPPSGSSGTVTIHPAPAGTALSEALKDQVHSQLSDKRVFAHPDRLAETGIIIVGGKGDTVSLNPQPLPPHERATQQIDLSAHTRISAGAFAAGTTERLATASSGLSFETKATRWGEAVTSVDGEHSAVVAALTRDNPTGSGTVRGIDFSLAENVAPVIR